MYLTHIHIGYMFILPNGLKQEAWGSFKKADIKLFRMSGNNAKTSTFTWCLMGCRNVTEFSFSLNHFLLSWSSLEKKKSDKRGRKHLRPFVTTMPAFFPVGLRMNRQDFQVVGLKKKLISGHSEYRTEVPTLVFKFGNGVLRRAKV